MKILLIGLCVQSILSFSPLLKTSSGIFRGKQIEYHQRFVHRYLAIPYGRIHQRFSPAELINHWSNASIIDATSLGPVCKTSNNNATIRYGIFSLRSAQVDEQCLVLNLFIPIDDDEEPHPIFLWIHGGSSQVGTGNLFDGTVLAARGNFIVVTFNYRLNLFGFLSTGDDELEGNVGLYDQALLLDWIDRNAASFRGDRSRITVAGHSAGAAHAYFLAISPFNRGRIRRLILQSGSPWNSWASISPAEAKHRFEIIADQHGCEEQRRLACLREIDFHQLKEMTEQHFQHTNVVRHGYFMRDFQRDLHGEDRLGEIDLIIGSNDDEGIFVAMIPFLTEPPESIDFVDLALQFLSQTRPKQIAIYHQALELYEIHRMSTSCRQSLHCYCSLFYNYSRLISDLLFYNDYYRFLLHRLSLQRRTFIYRYSHRSSTHYPTRCYSYLVQEKQFVGHFAELEYLWGIPLLLQSNIDRIEAIEYRFNRSGWTEEEMKFSEALVERWAKFIRDGEGWHSTEDRMTVLHVQLNETRFEPFDLPDTVQFWFKSSSSTCHVINRTITIFIILISSITVIQ